MLDKRIFVLTILFSVIYNSVYASPDCTVTNGFDIDKLEGTWHFIAVVSPRQLNVRCGHLYLQRESENRFTGSRMSLHNGSLRTSPLSADIHDDKLIMHFETWEKRPMKLNMSMKTCDGKSEFALEVPELKLYLLFGKSRSVSPAFLREYRAIGHKEGVMLRMMDNKHCS